MNGLPMMAALRCVRPLLNLRRCAHLQAFHASAIRIFLSHLSLLDQILYNFRRIETAATARDKLKQRLVFNQILKGSVIFRT